MREFTQLLAVIVVMMGVCGISAQTLQWDWAIGAGGIGHDQAQGLAVDELGNQYVTGSFYGNITLGGCELNSMGGQDVFVAKLDPAGNCVWAVSAGGTENDEGYEIAQASNGNVYLTGIYRGTAGFGNTQLSSRGLSDIFVAKLDNAGNWLWARSAGGAINAPDLPAERSNGIALDSDNNVLISGYFCGPASFGPFSITSHYSVEYQNYRSDLFVSKLDTNGNWMWALASESTGFAEGRAVVCDDSGAAYVTGHFGYQTTFGDDTLTSTNFGYDIFVSKLSADGNFLWTISASGIGQDLAADIELGPGNTLYITGSFKHPMEFGTIELAEQDVYRNLVAKLDSDGNWIWAVPFGGLDTQNDDAFLALDDYGNAFLTGVFYGTVAFGNTNLTSAGSYDTYIAKMSPEGTTLWALGAGGPDHEYGKGIGLDALGKVRVAGFFFEYASFGSTTLQVNEGLASDIFIASVGGGVPVSDSVVLPESYSLLSPVWPNPLKKDGILNVNIKLADRETGTFSVYNLRGQRLLCRQLKAGEQHIELNITGNPPGLYFCRMHTEKADLIQRFVVLR